jgi:hypothetical protein
MEKICNVAQISEQQVKQKRPILMTRHAVLNIPGRKLINARTSATLLIYQLIHTVRSTLNALYINKNALSRITLVVRLTLSIFEWYYS